MTICFSVGVFLALFVALGFLTGSTTLLAAGGSVSAPPRGCVGLGFSVNGDQPLRGVYVSTQPVSVSVVPAAKNSSATTSTEEAVYTLASSTEGMVYHSLPQGKYTLLFCDSSGTGATVTAVDPFTVG